MMSYNVYADWKLYLRRTVKDPSLSFDKKDR